VSKVKKEKSIDLNEGCASKSSSFFCLQQIEENSSYPPHCLSDKQRLPYRCYKECYSIHQPHFAVAETGGDGRGAICSPLQ
jgi:hypothetical protein